MSKKKDQQHKNIAFVDGQNLYMSTTTAAKPWKIDLARFYIYLAEKYNVENAYYFLGFTKEGQEELYDIIQEAGFILKFREHNPAMLGKKKGKGNFCSVPPSKFSGDAAGRFIRPDCSQKKLEFHPNSTANLRFQHFGERLPRRYAPRQAREARQSPILQGFATLRVAKRKRLGFGF